MQIRFVVRKRRLTVTHKEVLEYAQKVGVSLMDAKTILIDADPPVLQVSYDGVNWFDVQTVIEEK